MADETLSASDFDRFLDQLKKVPEQVLPAFSPVMTRATMRINDAVSPYPPATAANAPGRTDAEGRPMGYYERGKGWWYPIMTRETMAKAAAKNGLGKSLGRGAYLTKKKIRLATRVAGYKLLATSEQMGKRWTRSVENDGKVLTGIVGNNASYVQEVQGDRQASFHAARGWKTDNQAVEEVRPDILNDFRVAINQYLQQTFGGASK